MYEEGLRSAIFWELAEVAMKYWSKETKGFGTPCKL